MPPQTFQEFHPRGGVSASLWSPPTTVIVAEALFPFASLTDTSTSVRPAAFSEPVMMPVFGSSVSPAGRLRAEYVRSPSPDAGILNRNGRPGVAPVMRG